MSDVSETGVLVAIVHRGNTVPKIVHGANWSSARTDVVERLLGPDLAYYVEP